MARQENEVKCTNVFQSKTQEELKKRFTEMWIRMVNQAEKNKSVNPVKK